MREREKEHVWKWSLLIYLRVSDKIKKKSEIRGRREQEDTVGIGI